MGAGPTGRITYAAGGRLDLGAGFALAGSVQQVLAQNLDRAVPSDSQLPHVRSDLARYAEEGRDLAISTLYAERLWTPAPDWFARATAGYLEPMFAGVSGEVLWRPRDRPWAVGLDLNWVAQRDYDQRLGLQDYRVATGHLSVYADLPWWNLYAVLRGYYCQDPAAWFTRPGGTAGSAGSPVAPPRRRPFRGTRSRPSRRPAAGRAEGRRQRPGPGDSA